MFYVYFYLWISFCKWRVKNWVETLHWRERGQARSTSSKGPLYCWSGKRYITNAYSPRQLQIFFLILGIDLLFWYQGFKENFYFKVKIFFFVVVNLVYLMLVFVFVGGCLFSNGCFVHSRIGKLSVSLEMVCFVWVKCLGFFFCLWRCYQRSVALVLVRVLWFSLAALGVLLVTWQMI